MKPITYGNYSASKKYKACILIKESAHISSELLRVYVQPLVDMGVDINEIISIDLEYVNNKASSQTIKNYLDKLGPYLATLGVEKIMCCDTAYYKAITGAKKAESMLNDIVKGKHPLYVNYEVAYCLNYTSLMYNPAQQEKIDMGLKTFSNAFKNVYQTVGIKFLEEHYPLQYADIQKMLDRCLTEPVLVMDIESFGLKLGTAGIGSISFAWDIDKGCAFMCDYRPIQPENGLHGVFSKNKVVRAMLLSFFQKYQGKLITHSAFDIKQLIWELFMQHSLDMSNAVIGMQTLTKDFEDTKIMAYCVLNSTTKPSLKLKDLAFEYAGNWAENEINDIRKIDYQSLLTYNLKDTCATFWVYKKYSKLLVSENQTEIYKHLLRMQRVLYVTELHGLPMNVDKLKEVDQELNDLRTSLENNMRKSQYVIKAEDILIQAIVDKRNSQLKTKQVSFSDYEDFVFNFNSDQQLRVLLYEVMGFKVDKLTASGLAKVDAKAIKTITLTNSDPVKAEFLNCLAEYLGLGTLVNTFIPAFKNGILKADGRIYLHGNFNIGGTVSGRLSSSDPNLQNIPSGSKHGKLVKSIFQPPENKVLVYSDFNSLEDYVSALLSKDPNKLKVYIGHNVYEVNEGSQIYVLRDDSIIKYPGFEGTLSSLYTPSETELVNLNYESVYDDLKAEYVTFKSKPAIKLIGKTKGYDGHSLRAYSYFPDVLNHIPNTVNGINSISKSFPDERQKSKAPTFLLTYGGTKFGLMGNCGFSEEMAEQIETNYHNLYSASDEYTASRITQAAQDGYTVLAFGLKLRCPMLKMTVRDSRFSLRGTKEEERTLGNAFGQSYGLLNNNAMIEFMDAVWDSPYWDKIYPVAAIHDASYYVVEDDVEVIKFVNDNLIKAMEWQEDPAIYHPTVRIGGELDICYPSWAESTTLPKNANESEILAAAAKLLAS